MGGDTMRRTLANSKSARQGVTLSEVLVLIGVIGMLVALTAPAIQQVREQARLLACKDRLRQFGLAVHEHETFHRAFPYTSTTSGMTVDGVRRSYKSVSPHRALMHFFDPTIAAKFDHHDETTDFVSESAPVVSLSAANRQLQHLVIPVLLCPSDGTVAGATNYRANVGISPGLFPAQEPTVRKGAFVNGLAIRADEFTDGLSTTALFSERVLGDGDPARYDPWRDKFLAPLTGYTAEAVITACRTYATASPVHHDSFSGYDWLLGGWRQTWYDHIVGPNSPIPDCAATEPTFAVSGSNGIMAARSLHFGGVNVCFGDGTVKFVNSAVDLKIWRAIGTRNGGETVTDEL
jgi:type II secretory pathway pseudopilin PulG